MKTRVEGEREIALERDERERERERERDTTYNIVGGSQAPN